MAIPRIEGRRIQLIDKVMQCVGKRAGNELRIEINRQQSRTHVDALVTCHPELFAASVMLLLASAEGAPWYTYAMGCRFPVVVGFSVLSLLMNSMTPSKGERIELTRTR